MARDVHRLGEPLGRAIQQPALEIRLRREGERVNKDVETAPLFGDLLEYRFELPGYGDVERQEYRRLETGRQRLYIGPCFVVEISDRDLGADRAERLGAAIGNRMLVGDADDERAAAGQDRVQFPYGHMRHSCSGTIRRAIVWYGARSPTPRRPQRSSRTPGFARAGSGRDR